MKRWKIALVLLVLAVASALLHNLIYALANIEEPVFFLLTFVFGLGFAAAAGYEVFTLFRK